MMISTHSFVFEHGKESLLNDEKIIKDLLHEIVAIAKLTPLKYSSHKFSPQGLSATLILSESHIAIHTWPEHGKGYIVLTSCSIQDKMFIDAVSKSINETFKSKLRIAKEVS